MSTDYKNTINLPETEFAMKADLANREPSMLAAWNKNDLYRRIQERTAKRDKTFILHDGPPYANGVIHIGHAVNKILKDIVVKSKLLSGFRSPYVPGWDCHGLPIEIAVEKKVGKVGQKIDARAFRKACREYAAEQIDLQREDFKRLGVLGDWDQPYRTMDFKYEADMIRALAKIVANGHLLRGAKPVHWCFDCGSALAEAEIEYADKTSPAIDVAFDAVDPSAFAKLFGVVVQPGDIVAIPIWTTTPWTLPANLGVAVHADFDYVLVEGPARVGKRQLLVLAQALAESALQRYGVNDTHVLGQVKGARLENIKLQHPFYARHVPIILGEHVTADSGTGAVHTAPGHGQDDFIVGARYGLGVLNPVGGNGVYLPDTELFAGQHVWKANDSVIEVLRERGRLLANLPYQHSYPHCWRHKTPVAFRATPQWFISMDQAGLRANALAAIDNVAWIPDWGKERIAGMVEGRPDWCISRQRTWGVPIALFVHKSTSEPHPRSVELMETVAKRVEKEGADVWYELDIAELLGSDADHYEKVTDILDVWFDSGVTHACVLDARPELTRPANLYLEGSDQHRGWFQSSLLSSCAGFNAAPYREVLTHGFVVDAQGRKMSKSLGNVVAPQSVMKTLGADVLRLWVAATDYRSEMSVSDEILKRVSDAYRRIRNTARFLLGNLAGFEPLKHQLKTSDCLILDQWIIDLAYQFDGRIRLAYEKYDFHAVYQIIHTFCSVDLGAFYLDITKDRLYTMQVNSIGRRSAQTAMFHILEALVRWIAPILSFTAEEIWQHMPGERDESVLFQTWYAGLDKLQLGSGFGQGSDEFNLLRSVRNDVAKVLEVMRNDRRIGSSLDAEVTLYVDDKTLKHYGGDVAKELRFFFITSEMTLAPLAAKPDQAVKADVADAQIWIYAKPSTHAKCIRCWHYRPDINTHLEHPEICGRCVENVAGDGEKRLYF